MTDIQAALTSDDSILWLDIGNFTEPDIRFLHKLFGFHKLALDDCETAFHLPKLDVYKDYSFVIWHYFNEDSLRRNQAERLNFFMGWNYVVTLHLNECEIVDQIFEDCKNDKDLIGNGSQWLFHVIIDRIVDSYFPLTDEISAKLDLIEEQVFDHPESAQLKRVFSMKHDLFNLRKSIIPERDIISKFLTAESQLLEEKMQFYFRDVYDHLLRLTDFIETERELIGSIIEIHLSATSNKLNEVMQKLTIVATIFMPVTFLTGLYGMNFTYMPLLTSVYGFWLMVIFMAVVAGYMLHIMRRRGWW